MKNGFFLIALLLQASLWSQYDYPRDAFRSPLDIPLILAGTFGELRSNHFHSGIDIKTQQRTGLPIYAIGDGVVSRIKVSLWGFGKALYIAHPNGYTSVYAHLQQFSPEIEAYIKKLQYEKQSYEVEVFPDYGQIPVSKGNVIAYSGNTGGSSGPHLHFEIRNSITEKPTNPLLYGFEVWDATNPVINKVYAYPLNENGQVNGLAQKVQLNFSKQPDGTYRTEEIEASGTLGFGLNIFDRQDLAANRNGVYAVKQLVDGKVYTAYDFESFSFSETRYINTFIDYAHLAKYRERLQLSFRDKGNKLGIYKTLYNDGKIAVRDGISYNVVFEISDLAGNTTILQIPVRGKYRQPVAAKATPESPHYILADKPNNFDLGGAKVYFPANTFYRDFRIHLEEGRDTVTIHEPTVPAHRNFTITFNAERYPDKDRGKMFIARLDKKGRANYVRTYKRGNLFTTRTRNLGTYTLAMDTVPPKIRPKNFKDRQWLNNYKYLSLQISDDFSGVNSYKATLNGEWILMEYEPKRRTITYNFDDKILNLKQCRLQVVVTDNAGNKTTYRSIFFRN